MDIQGTHVITYVYRLVGAPGDEEVRLLTLFNLMFQVKVEKIEFNKVQA